MQKIILRMLGTAVLAAATAQAAAASDHHHARMTERATATEQFRQSNANAAPAQIVAQPDYSRYSGGMSAPAGR